MGDTSPQLRIDVGDLLAGMSRLAADGRGLEAVDRLTAANRAERHPMIEKRLVTLRHEIFPTLRSQPSTALSAEVVAEAPAGALSATDPHDLTVDVLRRGLAQHGCVLVRGLISSERAEALARGIDRAFDAFDACAADPGRSEEAPWYVPFTPQAGEYRVGGRRG
ncbi:MAG TPA: hypothetical protein VIX41_08720 [Acidimicrobiales bacterium]